MGRVRAEWQLTQMNGGYGDYTGWYFNANGGLTLNSSMFSGWLGEYRVSPTLLQTLLQCESLNMQK